jgi:hypothetical protein
MKELKHIFMLTIKSNISVYSLGLNQALFPNQLLLLWLGVTAR